MQISRGFDYAIRSLSHLASVPEGATAELKAIAEAQNIPVSYAAKVMRSLVRGGLVTSTLGREGGYALRRRPQDISLFMVYLIMEGELRVVECMDHESSCSIFDGCRQISVWKRLRHAVEQVLKETSIQDLAVKRNPIQRAAPKEPRYARSGA